MLWSRQRLTQSDWIQICPLKSFEARCVQSVRFERWSGAKQRVLEHPLTLIQARLWSELGAGLGRYFRSSKVFARPIHEEWKSIWCWVSLCFLGKALVNERLSGTATFKLSRCCGWLRVTPINNLRHRVGLRRPGHLGALPPHGDLLVGLYIFWRYKCVAVCSPSLNTNLFYRIGSDRLPVDCLRRQNLFLVGAARSFAISRCVLIEVETPFRRFLFDSTLVPFPQFREQALNFGTWPRFITF